MLNIKDIITHQTDQCIAQIENLPQNLVLYGAGSICNYYIRLCRANGIEPLICDSNLDKVGKNLSGILIQDLQTVLNDDPTCHFVITTPNYYNEIYAYLIDKVSSEKIIQIDCPEIFTSVLFDSLEYKNYLLDFENEFVALDQMLSDDCSRKVLENVLLGNYTSNFNYFESIYAEDQYFPKDLIALSNSEIFVDAGAYNGDTLLSFLDCCNNQFSSIHSFEPTPSIFKDLKHTYSQLGDLQNQIHIYEAGLYSTNQTIGFRSLDGVDGANHISNDTIDNSIEVVALDSVIEGPVTFIKMDIEGAELEALKGAQSLIINYKPKLAICVYHKNTDLIEIPQFIKSLNSEYKLYLRHHSKTSCETVLYAL